MQHWSYDHLVSWTNYTLTHTCNIGLMTIWSLGPTTTHAFMEEMEGEWPFKKPFGLKDPREELHMNMQRQSKWSGKTIGSQGPKKG